MRHLEYLAVLGASLDGTFDAALQALLSMGFKPAPQGAARSVALEAWDEPHVTRLRLPLGFGHGERLAMRLAQSEGARVLRFFATAGADWGWDAISPNGQPVCSFRSDHPRRGDEGSTLSLWLGRDRATVQAIGRILDPRSGAEGPEAVEAIAQALDLPYPAAPPARRALLLPDAEGDHVP